MHIILIATAWASLSMSHGGIKSCSPERERQTQEYRPRTFLLLSFGLINHCSFPSLVPLTSLQPTHTLYLVPQLLYPLFLVPQLQSSCLANFYTSWEVDASSVLSHNNVCLPPVSWNPCIVFPCCFVLSPPLQTSSGHRLCLFLQFKCLT